MNDENYFKITRKKLYDEIWTLSAMGVARQYGLNYPKLLQSCKQFNIPIPPSGYWTKKSVGKDVSMLYQELSGDFEAVILLTKNFEKPIVKKQQKNKISPDFSNNKPKEDLDVFGKYDDSILSFLNEVERDKVLKQANQIIVNENKRLHLKIIAYKKTAVNWWKQQNEVNRGYYSNYGQKQNSPQFITEISKDSFPRMLRILDAIFVSVEALGGKIYDNLSMKIRFDNVHIEISEAKDKIKHEITKNEAKELVKYNDAKRLNRYAYEPRIKKFDYIYNGKLKIRFGERHFIKDTSDETLESQLGEILITLYEKSEENRIEREKRELEEKIRKEKAVRAGAKRQAIKNEKKLTQALVNQSEDYQIACQIRSFIDAITIREPELMDDNWIGWAKRKADWFDPIIAKNDELLGIRDHKLAKEDKKLIAKIERRNWLF